MTRRLRVSEKTLEINVCAEILAMLRRDPKFSKAFWIGMKQRQENKSGIDDILRSATKGYYMALQFKAPRADPPNAEPYIFALNYDQLENLRRAAATKPRAVSYVLPHMNTLKAVQAAAPLVMSRTWALRVATIKPLAPGRHRIESSPSAKPPSHNVLSEPVPVELVTLESHIRTVFNDDYQASLLDVDEVTGWLQQTLETVERREPVFDAHGEPKRQSPGHQLGKMLQGLGFFCIPAV